MIQNETKKQGEKPKKAEAEGKRYLPYRGLGDIDDFIFEGNCLTRHSEK